MDATEEALRRERRAKMEELTKQLDITPTIDERTSAPSVLQVDQYLEQYNQADRWKQAQNRSGKEPAPRKRQLVQGGGIRPSKDQLQVQDEELKDQELESNIVEDAKQRQRRKAMELDQEIESVFGDSDLSSAGSKRSFGAKTDDDSMASIGDQGAQGTSGLSKEPIYRDTRRQPASQSRTSAPLMVNAYDSVYGQASVLDNESSGRGYDSFKPKLERQTSHTTKIYDDGTYIDDDITRNDMGYHSSGSPGSSNIGSDVLHMSLQDQQLRNKSQHPVDLSSSLRSSSFRPEDNTKAKCVFDARMFEMEPRQRNSFGADTRTEEEYFKRMQLDAGRDKTHNKGGSGSKPGSGESVKSARESFKAFLSNSFNKAFPKDPGTTRVNPNVSLISSGKSGDERDVSITTRNTDLESAPEIRSPPYESQTYKPEPSKPTVPPRSTLHIKKLEASTGAAEGPLSPADCIDLNEEESKRVSSGLGSHVGQLQRRGRQFDLHRSESPASSVTTEFGEVDSHGRSRQKRKPRGPMDILSSSFNGVLLMIPGLRALGTTDSLGDDGKWTRPRRDTITTDGGYEDDLRLSRKKRMSCGTIIFLLAVDIFTIGLVIILFSKLHTLQYNCLLQAQGDHSRGNPYDPSLDPTSSQQIGASNFTGNGTIPSDDDPDNDGDVDLNDAAANDESIGKRDERDINLAKSVNVFNTDATSTTDALTEPTSSTMDPEEIGLRLFNGESIKLTDPQRVRNREETILQNGMEFFISSASPTNEQQSDFLDTSSNSRLDDDLLSRPNLTMPTTPVTSTLSTTTRGPSNFALRLSDDMRRMKGDLQDDLTKVVEELRDEIRRLQDQVAALNRPPTFSCYKSTPHWNEGIVTYTRCNIRTEDIDPSNGVFTVRQSGIYRLSFTGMFNSQNGHRVTADIIRKTSSNTFDYLGRSAAETEEKGGMFGGKDDNVLVTASVLVLERLHFGDQIYVRVLIEDSHRSSSIHSTSNKSIHFNGQRISD